MPAISIKAEPVLNLFGFHLTNSLLTSALVIFLFLLMGLKYRSDAAKPVKTGYFRFMTFLLKSIYGLFHSVLNEKAPYFFPLLGSFFLYILLQNWFGLLPGVGTILIKIHEHGEELMVPLLRGNNADLNSTLALALISVGFIQYAGIKFLGFKAYISKFINLKNPMDFVMGILEIISEVSKVISFSFRLFGNIFAGEVLLTIIAFLIPVLASFPFLMMEFFFGAIQALVFAMLSSVFLSLAVTPHHQ